MYNKYKKNKYNNKIPKLPSSRKKNKKKNINKKIKFWLFTLIAFCFILPHVFNSVMDNILLKRISNSNINLSCLDYNFINKSKILLTNDILFNYRFLGEINTVNPLMEKPVYSKEMSLLKHRLKNLAQKHRGLNPGIFIWDYKTGKYVDINATEEIPTASIIKLPILCQLFKRAEMGFVNLDDTMEITDYYKSGGSGYIQYAPKNTNFSILKLSELMIQNSDNTATNMILSSIGGVNEFNRSLRLWGFSKTHMQTWLPDLTGTNVSTPEDIAIMLYNIDNPRFLSLQSRAMILKIMSNVKNRFLIQAGLPNNARFIHKTGDIGTMLGDAGTVIMPNGRKYIVVIMVKRPWNSYAAKQFIISASELIYKSFASNDL